MEDGQPVILMQRGHARYFLRLKDQHCNPTDGNNAARYYAGGCIACGARWALRVLFVEFDRSDDLYWIGWICRGCDVKPNEELFPAGWTKM